MTEAPDIELIEKSFNETIQRLELMFIDPNEVYAACFLAASRMGEDYGRAFFGWVKKKDDFQKDEFRVHFRHMLKAEALANSIGFFD